MKQVGDVMPDLFPRRDSSHGSSSDSLLEFENGALDRSATTAGFYCALNVMHLNYCLNNTIQIEIDIVELIKMDEDTKDVYNIFNKTRIVSIDRQNLSGKDTLKILTENFCKKKTWWWS